MARRERGQSSVLSRGNLLQVAPDLPGDLSLSVFDNYQDATAFFVERGYGGAVSLLRRLRLPASVAGSICSTLRMSFLVNLKAG